MSYDSNSTTVIFRRQDFRRPFAHQYPSPKLWIKVLIPASTFTLSKKRSSISTRRYRRHNDRTVWRMIHLQYIVRQSGDRNARRVESLSNRPLLPPSSLVVPLKNHNRKNRPRLLNYMNPAKRQEPHLQCP